MSTLDQSPERGRAAAEATVEVVQRFLPLLNRAGLLRRLEGESKDLPGSGSITGLRLILYLSEGRRADAEREIDGIARYRPESDFVSWARAQLNPGHK